MTSINTTTAPTTNEDVPVNELVDNHETTERERRAATLRACLPEDEVKLLEYFRTFRDATDREIVLEELQHLSRFSGLERHAVTHDELTILQAWRRMTRHQRTGISGLIEHLGHEAIYDQDGDPTSCGFGVWHTPEDGGGKPGEYHADCREGKVSA